MHFEQFEYRIGTHFLSALINGDVSGLSDEEEAELAAFEETVLADTGGGGHWATLSDDDDTDFGTCDVSGMGSDTRNMAYMAPRTRAKCSGLCYRQSARKHRRAGHKVTFWSRDRWGHTIYRWHE